MPPDGEARLERVLGLPMLVLYGLGTTVGAGIFALVGKVAGRAGLYAPVSFFAATVIAALTALCLAELSARFPKSAAEAVYVREGLRSHHLALAVGLLVAVAGIVSAAAITNGAVGYIHQFLDLSAPLLILLLVMVMGGLAAWGIAESVSIAAFITLVELGALVMVVWAGSEGLSAIPEHMEDFVPPFEGVAWGGIMAGAFLAFYAFLGFEDMVKVAEEVKDVTRTLPAAIILTLLITTLVYVAVALAAVSTLSPEELTASEAPLALIFERGTGASPAVISFISIFALLNGALIQIIMASRVFYGLGEQGMLPKSLSRVHPVTRTPLIATALVTGIVLALALWFGLEALAEATSAVTLVIFSLVNLSLILIKRRTPAPSGIRIYPLWVPAAGFIFSAGFLFMEMAPRIGG